MPLQTTDLNTFFDRLHVEAAGVRKFTWLIGAGLSSSAGIPLAKEVSIRIILFEHFIKTREDCPWWKEDDPRLDPSVAVSKYSRIKYDSEELEAFFDWIEEIEKDEEQLKSYLDPAFELLGQQAEFQNITLDQPKCYQLCFEHFFQDDTNGVTFLNHLVRRARGVNLAHLALAGILRDHKEWGNTVFTTNFDDLLLKALLQLNYNARVFGEFDTKTVPTIDSNYPQIVYLHGKHTGYNLLNDSDEVKLINPVLQEAFRTHIRNTNLIVIGYSGWDDLVMQTLAEWKDNKDLISGNLYWIPLDDQTTILDNVRGFLNQLPKKRVRVIVNEDEPLNADSFLLAICDYFNREKGGFTPYRREIIKNAERQHAFVIEQLREYPDYHPGRALKLLTELEVKIKSDPADPAVQLALDEIIAICQSDDIPGMLRADILQGLGNCFTLLRDYKASYDYLDQALDIYHVESSSHEIAKEYRASTHVLMAEIGYELYDLEIMSKHCKMYISEANREQFNKPDELCRIYLVLCHLTISKSFQKPILNLKKGKENAQKLVDSELWLAEFEFIEAIYEMVESNRLRALNMFEKVRTVYLKYGLLGKAANTSVYMANIHAAQHRDDEAESLLQEAITEFQRIEDHLGLANAYNTYGDILFQRNQPKESLLKHQAAVELYRKLDHQYNLMNGLTDIAQIYKHIEDWESMSPVLGELNTLRRSIEHPYFEYTRRSEKLVIVKQQNDEEE